MIDKATALIELKKAGELFPGLWISHSHNVAKAAELIALATNEYNSENAFIYGLLHDIGRRNGFSHIRHIYDGFIFFKNIDIKIAGISISHSLPNKNLKEYQGEIDINEFQILEIENFLNSYEYDFFDELIQLSDSYGTHDGFIKMELRWIDVALRNGCNNFTVAKWKKLIEIKNKIEEKYKINIDKILGL